MEAMVGGIREPSRPMADMEAADRMTLKGTDFPCNTSRGDHQYRAHGSERNIRLRGWLARAKARDDAQSHWAWCRLLAVWSDHYAGGFESLVAYSVGLGETECIGAPGLEPGTSSTQTMRATRLRHAPRSSKSTATRSEGNPSKPANGPETACGTHEL
jgi:hypothetical protein